MTTRHLTRKSDSQANAEALARRSATYADEHAQSWSARFDRPSHEPTTLVGYTRELRYAYESEMPERIHKHDIDGGGTPALSGEMAALLYGSPFQTDDEDFYRYPMRACLRGMGSSSSPGMTDRARLVFRVVTGTDPVDAAMAEGVPSWCAKVVALHSLRIAWRRLASSPLPRSVTAA